MIKNSIFYHNRTCTRIPDKMKTVVGDRMLYGFRIAGDMVVHCVIDFNDKIDEKRMARAARLTIDAEPVLGCSFIKQFYNPYWERCENLNVIDYCPVKETEDRDRETVDFLIIPFEECKGPQVRLLLFRNSDRDRLVIKINHMVADAGGVREYAYLLSEIYRKLKHDPDYSPIPNSKGDRSFDQIMYRFSFFTKLKISVSGLLVQKNWTKPNKYWSLSLEGSEPHYLFKVIPPEQFARIKEYAREKGATINDIILAVLMRTIQKIARPAPDTPMKLQTTADLRRYLPRGRGEAITNLSGFVYLNFGTELGDSLDETLRIVKREMDKNKENFIGLGDTPMYNFMGKVLPLFALEFLFKGIMNKYKKMGFTLNCLTNMGPLEEGPLNFGESEIDNAFTTASLVYLPNMVIGVSGFRDKITFSTGYFRPDENDRMKMLFDGLFENFPD